MLLNIAQKCMCYEFAYHYFVQVLCKGFVIVTPQSHILAETVAASSVLLAAVK